MYKRTFEVWRVFLNIKRHAGSLYLKFKYAFKLNKPLFLLRVIKRYFETHVLKMTLLKYIDFSIGYTCNLRCQHCFAEELKKSGIPLMTLNDYRRVAKEAMSLGALDFSFQGGELFLIKGYEDIITAFEPHKNLISITTNGTMLDKNLILKLKELGIDHLNVSLDSGIAEEHDRFRGKKGTFDSAVKAIDLALENGLMITISTVVSHESLYSDGFNKLVQFSKDRKILLNTIFAAPVGNWAGNMNVLLTEEDISYINMLRKENPFLRRDVDSNFGMWGCGSVKEVLYITAYGDVIPCPFIHISLGNVLNESLKDIRERGLKVKYFDHYHQKCLAAEDKEFIQTHLSRVSGKKSIPIDFEEGFQGAIKSE